MTFKCSISSVIFVTGADPGGTDLGAIPHTYVYHQKYTPLSKINLHRSSSPLLNGSPGSALGMRCMNVLCSKMFVCEIICITFMHPPYIIHHL